MTGTERKIFEIISDKEKISIFEIAKKMGISTDYASLICQGLKRHNDIDISGNCCSIGAHKIKHYVLDRAHKSHLCALVCRSKEKLVKKERGIPQKISKKREKQEISSLSGLKTVNKETLKILIKAGYKTIEDIIRTPFPIFMQVTGINLSQAAKIFNEAKKLKRVQ